MAGLYALAAAFFASLSVVYVLVCTFTPFLECGCLINARLPPSLAFCILYYNYTTRRARGVATLRLGLRVVIGPRRKSNEPGLQRLARHAHRILVHPVQAGLIAQPWRRTRPQGLCQVSTFYTTLVKKSHQANGASELRRTRLPRTPVNKVERSLGLLLPIDLDEQHPRLEQRHDDREDHARHKPVQT